MNKVQLSFRKNKYGMMIMVLSAVCTSFGQYFWKISKGSDLIAIFVGFVLYGTGALLMITAFKFGSFSVLHPMLSLGYIFALFIGYYMLGDAIRQTEIIGLVFILFGVTMIGAGDE
jgi:drug/metabolite transporter (DMT)-like permease